MNETLEEALRGIAADSMATSIIAEILLTHHFAQMNAEDRRQAAEGILQIATRTSQYTGVTEGNEALSELWADVIIRMHDSARSIVARSLARLETEE